MLWVCRLVPIVFWSLHIALFAPSSTPAHECFYDAPFLYGAWGLTLIVYLPFIWYTLPALLFEGDYRAFPIPKPFWYFIVATLTLGIVPVLWYWMKTDRALRTMAKNRETTG